MKYDELIKYIDFDNEAGLIWWRSRCEDDYRNWGSTSPSKSADMFNSKYAGSRAFNSLTANGYLEGKFRGVSFKAHRLIWASVFGSDPEFGIDHINGVKTDNRICNLRQADQGVNNKNASLRHDNKSGVPGVHWRKDVGRWRVRIGSNEGSNTIGYFDCLDDAIAARKAAESKYNYHQNHGRLK